MNELIPEFNLSSNLSVNNRACSILSKVKICDFNVGLCCILAFFNFTKCTCTCFVVSLVFINFFREILPILKGEAGAFKDTADPVYFSVTLVLVK